MNSSPEKEKMLAGELYQANDELLITERTRAKRLCKQFNANQDDSSLRELLGTSPANFTIEPFFRCDYGSNIHLGENFYANFDLVILDVCEVRIGRNCFIAPRVSICTAGHPVAAAPRSAGWEFGKPITIGDDVWIGAHAVINPGVTLGNRVVVASGAVVTKSFGDDVVLAGVPARVIKTIPQKDSLI
ncbi:sugar O-acetyltransferase [Roseibacillus ishigakijimensis]|uniref:Sugar O-acetyltransferase n=1 Tax=Roseibacillus ishigakijimensis TaxID=454146 RepID=A0A934RNW2_9BACT|nr:sugar O-acetyltransferase [Roseibacillus ishigakijimensis]MBK1832841.1 sugar O-acetyltransferase [Roseibacillus ishigakijimensis]